MEARKKAKWSYDDLATYQGVIVAFNGSTEQEKFVLDNEDAIVNVPILLEALRHVNTEIQGALALRHIDVVTNAYDLTRVTKQLRTAQDIGKFLKAAKPEQWKFVFDATTAFEISLPAWCQTKIDKYGAYSILSAEVKAVIAFFASLKYQHSSFNGAQRAFLEANIHYFNNTPMLIRMMNLCEFFEDAEFLALKFKTLILDECDLQHVIDNLCDAHTTAFNVLKTQEDYWVHHRYTFEALFNITSQLVKESKNKDEIPLNPADLKDFLLRNSQDIHSCDELIKFMKLLYKFNQQEIAYVLACHTIPLITSAVDFSNVLSELEYKARPAFNALCHAYRFDLPAPQVVDPYLVAAAPQVALPEKQPVVANQQGTLFAGTAAVATAAVVEAAAPVVQPSVAVFGQ